MYRHLATHLAVLAIGVGAGVSSIAVASQSGQGVTAPATDARIASDDPIVSELRKINDKLELLNGMISRATNAGVLLRTAKGR